LKWTIITGTLNEDQQPCLIIYRSVLLGIRNILEDAVEKIKTHVLFSKPFFKTVPFDNMDTNIELDRPQMAIWCMITNATNFLLKSGLCNN
jgi:hypothetical protein